MKKIFSVLLMMIFTLFSVIADDSTRKERNFIKAGNEYFSQGNYQKALEFYKNALVENSNSVTALYNIALAHAKIATSYGDSIAIKAFLNVPTSNPAIQEKVLYNLGNIAFYRGDSIQNTAGELLNGIIATSPEAIEFYKNSIDYYKQVLRLNPDNEQARVNLRVAQLRLPPRQNNEDGGCGGQEKPQQGEQENQDPAPQPEQQSDEQQRQQNGMSDALLEQVSKDEERTRRRLIGNGQVGTEENGDPVDGVTQQKPW